MGIYFAQDRLSELEKNLKAAAKEFGFDHPDKCALWLLESPFTMQQIEILTRHFTVGETYFFRDPNLFAALETKVLPRLIAERMESKQIRIWSAGCCTGEEPYTIAMILTKLLPHRHGWHIELLATDINQTFLKKARAGIYGNWSFRSTPAEIQERFFIKQADGSHALHQNIKDMVHFAYANLVDAAKESLLVNPRAMDIIFCRNVLIYFAEAEAKKTVNRFQKHLADGGYLFLAPSELTHASGEYLDAVNEPGAILLRKRLQPGLPALSFAPTTPGPPYPGCQVSRYPADR